MKISTQYYENIRQILDDVAFTQAPAIEDAATRLARSLAAGGVCHVFGSGHSAMIAREVVGRAGGLVPVNEIHDPTRGFAERVEGYGAALFNAYTRKYGFEPGEVLLVISNSGINPVPVELALLAREAGGVVVCITNLAQSRASKSKHSSGKRLFEVSDVVLDNRCPPGDAAVPVESLGLSVGATSTFAGALIVNLLMLATIEKMIEAGHKPPVLRSQNLPGADEWNDHIREKYSARVGQPGI